MKKLHKYFSFLIICLFLANFQANAQQECLFLSASSENTSTGSQVCIDVNVHNFTEIVGCQFSMVWNPAVLSYTGVQNFGIPSIQAGNFGTSYTASGKLVFAWASLSLQSYTLPDRSTLFTVCFDAIGSAGDATEFAFANDPIMIEVTNADFESVDFCSMPGMIAVGGTPVSEITLGQIFSKSNCANSINLIIDGGIDPLTFSWNGPNGFTSAEEDLFEVPSGWYAVSVTDSNGIMVSDSIEVGALLPHITSVVVNDESCSGFNDGTINVTVEGGEQPYTYLWSTGFVFEDLSGVIPGTYTITITDATGCTTSGTHTIVGYDPITLSSIDVSCVSDQGNDGFVTVAATGGTGTYSFAWSFGPTTSTGVYGGLAPGAYEVSVSDENNCPYIIVPFSVSEGIVSADSISVCGGGSAALSVDAPSGALYFWRPDATLSCTDCPNPIASPIQTTTYYLTVTDTGGCADSDSLVVSVIDGCVWPGDSDVSFDVQLSDLINIGLGAGETGPARPGANLNWSGVLTDDWANETPVTNINFKYADCDGNGLINADDTTAIALNLGEMHNVIGSGGTESQFFPDAPVATAGGQLFQIEVPDTLMAGSTVELPIIMGTSNTTATVYGMAFGIDYDAALVEPGSVSMLLTNSWLGTLGPDLIMMQRNDDTNGRLDVAITGMDGLDRTGFGQIGVLKLTLKSITGNQATTFAVINARVIDHQEKELEIGLPESPTIVAGMMTGVNNLIANDAIRVFPNPANDVLYINAGEVRIEAVQLFDLSGRQVDKISLVNDEKKILLPAGLQGTYLLQLNTSHGVAFHRVVILR